MSGLVTVTLINGNLKSLMPWNPGLLQVEIIRLKNALYLDVNTVQSQRQLCLPFSEV